MQVGGSNASTARPSPSTGPQPALVLPDKPSIAVLPFDNLSVNQNQNYLADGIVEAITAALSRIGSFFVIARNSAFAYKGRPMNERDIGQGVGRRLSAGGQRADSRQPHSDYRAAH